MWYLDVNSVKTDFLNTFFPLSHTFYFKTRPSPLSKIKESAFGAHFLQLYRKNEYCDPLFLFHDFNKKSTSFRWEKNWRKSMFSFWQLARVQFISTLERKVKTRALKGIFLVRRWMNNTLKSNSVRFHMHHWKNLSLLSSFELRAVFVKGSKIAVFYLTFILRNRIKYNAYLLEPFLWKLSDASREGRNSLASGFKACWLLAWSARLKCKKQNKRK